MISFWSGTGNLSSSDNALSLENIRIERETLRPGEELNIFFRLTEDAKVTVLIYDPDYDVVRTLIDQQERPAGTINVVWDGRDDSGTMVPDEAYLFTITAEGSNNQKVTYNPTAFSGGEKLNIQIDRIEKMKGGYNIHYSLPDPSRVSIRAGIHNGPLLKTVIDWKPLPAGDYSQPWDGKDETCQVLVVEEPEHLLYIRAFLLPENSIIVQGSGTDYQKYRKSLKPEPSHKENRISYQSVRQAAIERARNRISHYYLIRRKFDVIPKFRVCLNNDRSIGLAERAITMCLGQIDLAIEVEEESLYNLDQSGYEILIFLDNKRFDEMEQPYAPFTYSLDTTRLTNGEHFIAINLMSTSDQIGSYCFKIMVDN